MTDKVKGILIDPFECMISEVEVTAGDINTYYPFLSHETKKVHTFTVGYSSILAPGDAVFVDDEGLYGPMERFFSMPGLEPITGRGLILGSNGRGATTEAKTSLDLIERSTFFLERIGSGLLPTTDRWEKS